MRIAYVYDAVHPWETGGVQTRIWELSRRLAKEHEVHWYGMKFWDGPAVRSLEGVTFHGVTEPGSMYVNGRRSISGAIRFAAHLVRPLLSADFDVIDCQEFPYLSCFPSKFSALANRSPLVMTWHEVWGDYWYEYLGWKGLAGKTIERLVATLPDEHLAVSMTTQRGIAGLGVGQSRVVPNGISMEEIDQTPVADDSADILFVGRLIKEKNGELLVRAIDELRNDRADVNCRIIGEGPEAGRIDQLIDELELTTSVERSGFLDSHEELLGEMKAAEVFALPSRREGFGITALEALACGTPVVTIDHPQNAITELIDDGVTGFICEQSSSALATSIKQAAREGSSAECIDAARDYDWDRIVDQIERIYLDLC